MYIHQYLLLTMGTIRQNLYVWLFLNLYGKGQANSICYHHDHCTEGVLRSDIDPKPNMPKRFLRP